MPWECIDNRPFLRCLNGYGLCLWRLHRFAEAEPVFDRMLRLNPTDNQGVRFLLAEVQSKKAWQDPTIPGGEREDRRRSRSMPDGLEGSH